MDFPPPNKGKELEAILNGVTYARFPIKTRLIENGDDLFKL